MEFRSHDNLTPEEAQQLPSRLLTPDELRRLNIQGSLYYGYFETDPKDPKNAGKLTKVYLSDGECVGELIF